MVAYALPTLPTFATVSSDMYVLDAIGRAIDLVHTGSFTEALGTSVMLMISQFKKRTTIVMLATPIF